MRLVLLLSLAAAPTFAQELCALEGSVVLQADGRATKGTVVAWVDNLPGRAAPRAKTNTWVIRQHNRKFEPQVLVVLQGDEVQFINDDKDEHGVFSNSAPASFEFPYTRKGVTGTPAPFIHLGHVHIGCDIHASMRADVLVVPNKFFATADEAGHFRIDGLPRGPTYRLKFWEPNGAVQVKEVRCSEELVKVGEVRVTQAPAPARLRKHGEAYPPTWQ